MKGRFAPSPTGHIHLGNVWIALLAYASVYKQKGSFLLRMEDIDTQRSSRSLGEELLDDLEWLGFTWDEGPRVGGDNGPYWQSERSNIYDSYIEQWKEDNLVYPCFCNRARLQTIAGAWHEGEHKPFYDGLCRNLSLSEREDKKKSKTPSLRLKMETDHYLFTDIWQKEQRMDVRAGADDIVIKRADGMFAYNLAVVLDDYLMGVTEVIRGYDLLSSTAVQQAIYKTLQATVPRYGHAPLLVDSKGIRLSKRQASITIKELRDCGYSPAMVWGHLARETNLVKLVSQPKAGISLSRLVEQMDEELEFQETHITILT